jgi:hypothetical protein
MDPRKKTAQLAGVLYLLASIPGAFAFLYVSSRVMVEGNVAATADRIRASESLLRLGIGAELVGTTIFIFVALTLYRLFQPVSPWPALAMLVLILLSVPISFIDVLTEVAAIRFAGGGTNVLSAVDAGQRDALAYFSLELHAQGISVAQIFWGLWLFPFGICVMRSGFLPRVLGVLLMVAGVGHTASALTDLAAPQHAKAVAQVTQFLTLGELPIIFWLLIRGAKPISSDSRPLA